MGVGVITPVAAAVDTSGAAAVLGDTDLQEEIEAGAEGETVGVGVGVGVEVEVEVDEPEKEEEGLPELETQEDVVCAGERLGSREGLESELSGEIDARGDGDAGGDSVKEGYPERLGEGLDPVALRVGDDDMPSSLREEEWSGDEVAGVLGEPESWNERVLGLAEAEGVDEWESETEADKEARGEKAKLDSFVNVGGADTGKGEAEGDTVGVAVDELLKGPY